MLQRLTARLRQIWNWICRIFLFVFGKPQWQTPAWVVWLKPHIQKVRMKSQAFSERHRKVIWKSGVALTILLAIGAAGYWYWDRLPKPQMINVTLSAPAAMELADKATPNYLVINFDASAAPLDQVGKETTTAAKLKPAFEGTWYWSDDKTLMFKPKTDWPVDKEFEVELLTKNFPKHFRLSTDELEFRSPVFQVLGKSASYYQHPEDPKDKRVTAEVSVSHPIDPESVKGKITIKIDGNSDVLGKIPMEYQATVTYDKFFGKVMITSEKMPLPLKDTTARIKIKSGWKTNKGGNAIKDDIEMNVDVPGMYSYFKITSTDINFSETAQYELEQILVMETTTEVSEKDFDKALEVYLLPKFHPSNEISRKRNYSWGPGEVTPEILKAAEKAKLIRVPGERAQSKMHTFKLPIEPERSLYVKLNKGLKSFHEYILAEDFISTVQTKEYPRETRILHEGAILSMSGDRKLSVLTRGTKSFQVEVGHVLPDQLNHLLSQTSGRFASPEFNNSYSFNWENISEKFTEIIDVAESNSGKPEFAAVDAGKFLNKSQGGGRGLLYVRIQPYDREKDRAYGTADSRFLLVSDLGVIVKKTANNSRTVFVQSIQNGQPVSGVSVSVVGKNGVDVTSRTTDGDGSVEFPDLKDFKNEKQPLAIVVRKGQDLSFLPLNRYDRQLEYSRFDTGGLHVNQGDGDLKAYVFSDRGLYRPGEEFHLSSVVRSLDWKTKLSGLPMEWVVTDPKGQEIYKEKVRLNAEGMIELNSSTEATSFVGTYTGSLFLIERSLRDHLLGSTTFRVEEFVPDRMKISSGFSAGDVKGWVNPENLKAWARVMDLFGVPGEGRKVKATLAISPAAPFFAAYRDYRFFASKTDKSYDETLSETETNDKGEVEYAIDMSKFEAGNYRLRFEAEAFEPEGGRSVVSAASIMVSPAKYFIGFKTESTLNYIKLNTEHKIDFIAVDPSLAKAAVGDLQMRLVEKEWVSVLTKQGNGTFKYESVSRDKEHSKTDFQLAKEGSSYVLPTANAGDFKIILTNKQNVDVAQVEFTVIGEGNILGKIDRNAELQIKLVREDFKPGEEIEMQIRAPYVGSGLITIERDRVYAKKWFRTTSNNSMQSIKLPADLEGNAYINVTFLRDISSKEIFMSPLSYGVVPFSVDLKKRQLQVDLKAPVESKPGQPMKIEFSSNKAGKIVVFAVNEGILQVAKYQTPDPLKLFFQKRALEVETSQLLDLVLPEYRIVKELSASGGDGEGDATSRNLNPFRRKGKPPVAYWSGVIDLKAGTQSVTYNVPDDFNGTLRVMAVAVSEDAIGVMRTDALVRGDYIITPTVPFVLTPGDEAQIGITVFNNKKGSGPNAKVKVSVKSTPELEVLGSADSEMAIPETKEGRMVIRVRAKDQLGVAKLEFTAGEGTSRAKISEEISMRPLTPFRTTLKTGTLTNSSVDLAVDRKIYANLAVKEAGVSYLPLSLATGLVSFLDGFPYGCTEQLISKAFPILVLGDYKDFNYKAADREKAFRMALSVLRSRQTSDGGFGLYWSYGQSETLPSLYAIHYLWEAKDKGMAVPQDLQDRVKDYLKLFPNRTVKTIYDARVTAYALYLLAVSGQNVGTEVTALLKETETEELKKIFPEDVAAAFIAGALKIMKQDRVADPMIARLKMRSDIEQNWTEYHDQFIHNAFTLYVTARHFPQNLKKFDTAAVDSFIKMIESNQFNTLNSSLAVLALERMGRGGEQPTDVPATLTETGADGAAKLLTLPKALFPKMRMAVGATKLAIKTSGDRRVYYQLRQTGFDLPEAVQEIRQKIEISREYRKPKSTSAVTSVKQGEELEVHIQIRGLEAGKEYPQIAIVDLLPSGFEVVLERTAHEARMNFDRLIQPVPSEETKTAFYQRPALRKFEYFRLLIDQAHAQDEDNPLDMPPPPEDPEGSEDGEGTPRAYGDDEEGTGEDGSDAAKTSESAEIPTLALPGSNLNLVFEEPREDRVVLYARVGSEMTTYIYKIKATNQGTFKVPPPFAEDLYDRTVTAQGKIGSIKVEAP